MWESKLPCVMLLTKVTGVVAVLLAFKIRCRCPAVFHTLNAQWLLLGMNFLTNVETSTFGMNSSELTVASSDPAALISRPSFLCRVTKTPLLST